MTVITRGEVKRMSDRERLAHYEAEKRELFENAKNVSAEQLRDAHEALREKWMV